MKTLILTLICLLGFSCTYAQYQGPKENRVESINVAHIMDNADDLDHREAVVQVKGFIAEQISDEEFWFEDSSGRLKVEIDEEIMPNMPFDQTQHVVLTGEIDEEMGRVKMEVAQIELVDN
ncbi:NirD/YgiW/YdeI family stress tolerance protein [Pontibacter sp. G13]|uniref:NirD/YgiW/YdeI family stress tolerance protein n=1 Tax=Pontibacter sp. G13 TaxID=3074898 RepID=UPI00288B931A|nr:NirD/YgiW/YdeI family stress tolerance protein [Pontibacter sp. G13]WNJ18647.1 NirD/YgiW/YdeI family stress tolerance protein [Pontibacter sp. G13]